MHKKNFAFAAIVAAILSIGTAKTANAMAASGCYEACAAYYGESFYAPGYFYDDFGNLGGPGDYGLVGCYESGNTTVCVYSQY